MDKTSYDKLRRVRIYGTTVRFERRKNAAPGYCWQPAMRMEYATPRQAMNAGYKYLRSGKILQPVVQKAKTPEKPPLSLWKILRAFCVDNTKLGAMLRA